MWKLMLSIKQNIPNVSSLCPAGCEDLGDVPGPLRSPLKQTEIFKGERATLLIIFEQDWEPGGVVNIKVSVVFVSSLKIGDTPWHRLEIERSFERYIVKLRSRSSPGPFQIYFKSFQSISIQNQMIWTRSWCYFHCATHHHHQTFVWLLIAPRKVCWWWVVGGTVKITSAPGPDHLILNWNKFVFT